jgi:dTMP kinase
MTGLLLAFEGGEGSGKSTQVKRLAEALGNVVVTRQPGGTAAGTVIRRLLLDSPAGSINDRAEALLYAADRAQHVAEVIQPALDAGHVVVSDRYVDSSLAYQAAGRAMGADWIATLSSWATAGLVPDLTVLLDIDPAVGLARAARRGAADRLEAEALDFHHRVREAYLSLADAEPGRYFVLDANRTTGQLANAIAMRVQALIETTSGAAA